MGLGCFEEYGKWKEKELTKRMITSKLEAAWFCVLSVLVANDSHRCDMCDIPARDRVMVIAIVAAEV